MVNKLIKSLKVNCLHVAAGCEWQGDVLDAQPHLESKCLYEEISSSYSQSGCDIKIPRHILEAHLQQCEFRQSVCDYCGESFLHSFLPVHFQECESFPVLCSHGCNMMVVRKSTDNHLQTCPELSVECPFKDAGCLQKLLRKGLHDHEVSTVTSHLLSTKRKLESELQTTRNELIVTKGRLDEVEEELRKTKMKLETACESFNELSLKSQADIEYEVMIWENYKTVISSCKEKFQRKLSDNLADIVSKLLNSSEAVNDVFADLVVKTLNDFAERFIATLPSVEEYTKQIESLFSPDFQKIWVLRLKQHFVIKAALEFSFFKSELLQECEKYRGNRANSILTICLMYGVSTAYFDQYLCIELNGNIGEPRLIDSKITFIEPERQLFSNTKIQLMSLTDDLQTVTPPFKSCYHPNTRAYDSQWKSVNARTGCDATVKRLFCTYFGIAWLNEREFEHKYVTIDIPDVTTYTKNGYALLRKYH